ncbi:hypothetical protein H0W32_03205 [Patescibacteria group bacterium]|nr:hypothetical protein [Patescibacteria group bacterium]
MPDQRNTVMVENARLVFRNFAGKEGQYNREGDRNFGVILPEDIAQQMLEDGWNIKYLSSREDDEPDTPWISVAVNFKNRPPKVVVITSTSRTHLSEDSVEVLDWADVQTADLIITPYVWEVNDKSGVKAYLKSLYITIEEDDLDRKYAQKDSPRDDFNE